jgi:hypothetical protein
MNLKLWLIIIIVLILALSGFLVYYLTKPDSNNTNNQNTTLNNNTITAPNACLALNCSSSTKYVGSVNSDKYYVCDCRYAKNINPENIVCFASDAEAQLKNYTKIQC